jgi:hypothetical protein
MELGGGLLNPQIHSPSDLFSFSHVRNASRLEQDYLGPLRTASASPTGMRATMEELVSRWKDEWRQREDGTSLKNDPELKSGVGRHPRLGIGLAMCNIFARCARIQIHTDAERRPTLSGISVVPWSSCPWMDGVSPFGRPALIYSTLTLLLIQELTYIYGCQSWWAALFMPPPRFLLMSPQGTNLEGIEV